MFSLSSQLYVLGFRVHIRAVPTCFSREIKGVAGRISGNLF